MKPIRLELSGLNSYIDKQIVDFEKLTTKGLFGIFGNTGSGKSTILDAITLAMYDEIARDTNGYINSSCEKATVAFEFEIGSKNSHKRYRVERTIVRNEIGNTIDIKSDNAKLIELYNSSQNKVLADKVEDVNKKIIQVVGLTASDFTRAVVLPQGKFNAFLKLTDFQRRDMLERIFNLEEYGSDLYDKVRRRKKKQLQDLRDINIKISQYDGLTEERYIDIEKDLEHLKELKKEKEREFDLIQNDYEESKKIYEEQLKLEKYEKRKKDLDSKSNDIKDKTIQLEKAINAEKVNPYIFGVQNLEKKIDEDVFRIEILENKLSTLNQELVIIRNRYEEAYNIKNEKIPKLSEYKSKLERALKIELEIVSINEELKFMKQKGNELNKEKESLESLKKDFESKKESIIKYIKELDIKLDKLKISSELKQKVFLTHSYEKEYNKIVEEKNQKIDRVNEIYKEFDELNLKSKYIQRDRELIERKLDDLITHQDALLRKCPGKNEDILSKIEYITELKSKVEVVKLDEDRRNKIQGELNIILEKKYNTEREINITNDRLENNRKNILDLEKEVDRLRYLNLASELKKELKDNMACPVCGSRNHDYIDLTNKDDSIEFTRSKLEKLQKEEYEIRIRLEELNSKHSEYISFEKIKTKDISELKSKLGDMNYNELSNKLDEEQRKLEVLKNGVRRWQEDKDITEEKINSLREEKWNIEKDEVKILESINNYKKFVKEIKEDIEALEISYENIKSEYLGLKSIINTSDLSEKVEEINKNEKLIEELNKEYSDIINQRYKNEESIIIYQNKLHQIELELMKNKELYVEKERVRDVKYNEVIAITKGESSKLLLENLEETLDKITKVEEKTKKKLEEQRIEYEKYLAEKHNIEGRLKTYNEQYKIQESTLKQLLEDNKFESIYDVKKSILSLDHTKRLGQEVSEYEEEQKVLTCKIKDLKDELAGRRIKIEEFDNIKNNIYNLKVEIDETIKDIGAKQNILCTLKDSLDKVKELNKELKLIKHKLELLEELESVIKGNRFVEYVSTNKFKSIAIEASNKLEIITNGRYALEVDSSLNFVIRDNFNGGDTRSVDTLSGGETFLTSLSLALALSSQIQLKGNSPLEVLFLDEGFGSLDDNLLDTVMESLESLHSNQLSIGIISHIEELKHRVPVKLLVRQSEAGIGSKVEIEYS